MDKNIARLRRAKTTRSHIRVLGVARLSVLRSGQHIYAQVFTADGSKVLASASTLQADVKDGLKNGKNSDAASKVGKLVIATTAGSRPWPKLPARVASSSKASCLKWLRHEPISFIQL